MNGKIFTNKRLVIAGAVYMLVTWWAAYCAYCAAGAGPVADRVSSFYVDGTDFAPFANLLVFGTNGIVKLITLGVSILFSMVISFITALLVKFFVLRRPQYAAERKAAAIFVWILCGAALAALFIADGWRYKLFNTAALLPIPMFYYILVR